MSGGGTRKGRKKSKKEMLEATDQDDSEHEEHSDGWAEGLAKISKEINELTTTLRTELLAFKNELKTDIKQEINTLRLDMDQKFRESNKDLEEQKASLTEAQARISELEDMNADANDSIQRMLTQTRNMQDKLTDLEARSRRNNIRIFGLPEDNEGDSVACYLDKLFKKELDIPGEEELQIQRAHRTPSFKPKPGQPPRTIVVNFLKFETKEMLLRKAWQKKIRVADSLIQFDHDYPTEIVKKRRTYLGLKKVLKERGVRFQTPFTRIRIHWSDGVKSYDTATEAAHEMRARGFTVNMPGDDNDNTQGAVGWQRVRGGSNRETAQRAREKLREYERIPDTVT